MPQNTKVRFEEEHSTIRPIMMQISDVQPFWNSRQHIIRVKHPERDGGYFDLYIGQTIQVPNPDLHAVVAFIDTKMLNSSGIDEELVEFAPGIADEDGNLSVIPEAVALLVDKKQTISIADPQSGSPGFSISNTNMFDEGKIRISISPPISKDYTNNRQNDQDKNQIGTFMNDDSVLVRSRGASITMGDEGIHIAGNVFWESTKHTKEIMQDNPLHGLIPQTIPTAIVSIPQIPNIAKIAQVANASIKFIEVVDKLKSVSKILG